MKNNILYRRKNRKGFTLAELLMTVAILLIVFALAVPAIFAIQRNLRQKELDSKAEIIYTAVQDRLTEIYGKGNTSLYEPSAENEIYSIGSELPDGYDAPYEGVTQDIYYFVSGGKAASNIVKDDVLDSSVKNGHWVVEIIPYAAKKVNDDGTEQQNETNVLTAPSVFAVYYSESVDITEAGQYAKTNGGTETARYLVDLRDIGNRKDKDDGDARIGYYGGSSAGSGSKTSSISVTSAVINSDKEINTAEVKIVRPTGVRKGLNYVFSFTDDYDHQFNVRYEDGQWYQAYGYSLTDNDSRWTFLSKDSEFFKNFIDENIVATNYSFTFTLDNLKSDKTRFKSLLGSESGHESGTKGEPNYIDACLKEGSDIHLYVYASCKKDNTVESYTKTADGNSLYAYMKGNGSINATDKKVYIQNGRHLQNLDKSSGVSVPDVNSAVLIGQGKEGSDNNVISFGTDSDFYTTYKDAYFNGKTEITTISATGEKSEIEVPDFKSITNENITSISSQNEKKPVEILNLSTSGSGLFEVVNTSYKEGQKDAVTTIKVNNVNLVGLRIDSKKTAGGFVGEIKKGRTVEFTNCQIYLGTDDIPATIEKSMNMESVRWIKGEETTGGLVGKNNGTVKITKSSVSSVLGTTDKESLTGGLVGENNGTVSITKSYTDSYLYGKNVAGFVGNNKGTVTVENSYTAGFIGLDQNDESTGAGFVNGNADVKTSYSILACYNVDTATKGILRQEDNGLVSLKGAYYSTVSEGKMDSVYYLKSSVNKDNVTGSKMINSADEIKNLFGNSEEDKSEIVKYQLMGQALESYDYPTISNLMHYGDWTASFVPGALVYYEEYSDGTFGFEGANLDVTLNSVDKTIVGDGYGVIYSGTDNPGSVEVTVGSKKSTMTIGESNTSRKVTKGSDGTTDYFIYPLDKADINPDNAVKDVNGFFENVTLKAGDNTKEYYFNPHFARTVSTSGIVPETVSIRSPRHLYDLSKFYNNAGYREVNEIKQYRQERDMIYSVYHWNDYYKDNVTINEQNPIGDDDTNSFKHIYNGQSYRIGDVTFFSSKNHVGMFGVIDEKGNVRNVVLATQYDPTGEDSSLYRVYRNKAIGANEYVYEGILVGYNKGQIDNCAVTGYYISEKGSYKAKINGFANSHLFVGGFVGRNDGKITNSSADNPKLSLDIRDGECYAGGFVGYNNAPGEVSNCYALSNITSETKGESGHTVIAGFAGYNSSTIDLSYCASALTSSGDYSSAYAFGSREGNGFTRNSYYLTQGSYRYVDGLHVYGNGGTMEGSSSGSTDKDTTGVGRTYEQLQNAAKVSGQIAESSSFNLLTEQMEGKSDVQYPFRAVVKKNGKYVHYGEWVVEPALGNFGVFYWEHEENGENNGYKFTYVGFLDNIGYSNSTLCESHDDSGVITEYGYGYYVSSAKITENPDFVQLKSTNITMGSEVNKAAQDELQKQMPGITFYPYTTSSDASRSDRICLVDDFNGKANGDTVRNGTWKLTVGTGTDAKTFEYSISPFFANAIAVTADDSLNLQKIERRYKQSATTTTYEITTSSGTGGSKVTNVTKQYYKNSPGRDDNPYEIRSAQQLQFINWNGKENTVDSLVKDDESNYKNYNYLMYTDSTGSATQSRNTNNSHWENREIKFVQSHDLNADSISNFIPIAGQATSSQNSKNGNGGYCAILYSWFGGSYDGQSYKIQDLKISSNSFTVGLFGVTAGAKIQNVIMYSENNAYIIREKQSNDDPDGAYAIGGLVGVAYNYSDEEKKPETLKNYNITNCAIAGYQIIDASTNKQTLGEANVGGLIGVSNISMENCSAVTDITIKCTHKDANNKFTKASWGNHIRVGGLSGALQYEANNCYTGGNIKVEGEILNESYDNDNPDYNSYVSTNDTTGIAVKNYSTNIYVSGISGSGFAMNYQNFTNSSGLKEGAPSIKNCYTYVSFPDIQGTIRSISMIGSLADRFSVAPSQGKYLNIENCYYLKSSEEFSIDNAPKYMVRDEIGKSYNQKSFNDLLKATYDYDYASHNKDESYWPEWFKQVMHDRNTTSMTIKELMCRGDDAALDYIYNQWPQGTNWTNKKANSKYEVTAKTYKELSSKEFINTLNGQSVTDNKVWDYVTSKYKEFDEEIDISGIYSFNTGVTQLKGKNYPFPTVVKQGTDIRVHYGKWPVNGPHWTSGSDSMDIFNDMNMNSGIAEKTFTLNIEDDKDFLNAYESGSVVFRSEGDYIDKIKNEDIVLSEDSKTLTVKVRAMKAGSTTVSAEWKDSQGNKETADFTLNVTANMNLTIPENSRSLILGAENSSAEVHASLKSTDGKKDFTADSNVEWNATSSKDNSQNIDDVGVTNNSKGKFTIEGKGLNGSVTISASYTYKGQKYSTSARLTVKKQEFIGLSDNNDNYEVTVPTTSSDGNIVEGKKTTNDYTENNRPSYTTKYYLYEFADSQLIENSSAGMTAILTDSLSGGDAVEGSSVTFDQNAEGAYNFVTIGNYKYLGITVNTDSVRRDITDPKLVINIIRSTSESYRLSMDLTSVDYPYVLTFKDDNNTSLSNEVVVSSDTKQVEINSTENTSLNNPGNGYVLEGWYAYETATDSSGNSVTNKIKVLNADGTAVDQAEGYACNGKLALKNHFVTLHPKWVKYTYTKTDTLDDEHSYLVLNQAGTFSTLYENVLDTNGSLISYNLTNVNLMDNQLTFDTFDDLIHCMWKKKEIENPAGNFGTDISYYIVSEVPNSDVWSYTTASAVTQEYDIEQQSLEETDQIPVIQSDEAEIQESENE